MLGLGLGLNKQNSNALGSVPPYRDDALHYSPIVIDTTRSDRTGIFDRTSVMSRMAVGDASTYIRFVDFVSTALTYYDIVLGTEVVTATDGSGDFVLPTNGIAYIDISTYRWIFEEITDPTDNSQTTFYDTSGTYEAQAYLTHAGWVTNSVQGVANSDEYGVTVADGSTHYKDEAHTLLYDAGQPLHALDNGDGTFSKTFCKAWLDTGSRALLDSVGRIKHQVDYGVALQNSVTNGDFSDGTTGWSGSGSTISATSNISSITGSGSHAFAKMFQTLSGWTLNDRTYGYCRIRVTNADAIIIYIYFRDSGSGTLLGLASISNPTQNQWYEIDTLVDISTLTGNLEIHVHSEYPDAATANGKVMEVDGTAGVFTINMTELGIETWSEAQMLTAVQEGYFDEYKFFAENYTADPNSLRLAQDYPLVQSADLTDTLIDDHTLDEPTNAVVDVATLNYQIGNQIFSKVDSGDLSKFLVYDRVMTNEEIAKILLFLGTGEFALDSDGDFAIDSNGDMAVAPKSEYYL